MANSLSPADSSVELDLRFDDCNCGAPGFECPPGTICVDGVCVPYDVQLMP